MRLIRVAFRFSKENIKNLEVKNVKIHKKL